MTTTSSAAELARFSGAVFRAVGMRAADAELMSRSIVEADRTGVGTHGTARLLPYTEQLASGQVTAAPDERILVDRPSAVLVDAGNGFGAPAGIRAIDLGIVRARETGVCMVGVTRVAHFGAAGYFTRYAAEHGFLAIAMSTTSPSVVPFGGRGPRIGNSPMSFASPGTDHPELVMDMAQSMTSRGRIKVAQERGQDIPAGWAIGADGAPTTDPELALAGAVLTSGGHKGSAMSLMVEMLASGLTGAHLTQEVRHGGFTSVAGGDSTVDVTVGNWFLVVDADVFGDDEGVRGRATRIAEYVRASDPAPGFERVLAPGDLERATTDRTDREGIPLLPSTVDAIHRLAERYGIAEPALSDDASTGARS